MPLFQDSDLDLGNIGLKHDHVGFQNSHIRRQAGHIAFHAKHIDFQRFNITADRCRPPDSNTNEGRSRSDPRQIMQQIHQTAIPRFPRQVFSMRASRRSAN